MRDAVENARRQNQMPPYGHDNRMDHMSGRRDGDDAQSGGRGRTDSDADDDRSGRQPRNPEDVRTGGPQLHRSSSRRSRSPRRADSANPIRYRDRTSPPSYRPRPFGDPYRAADHEFERDTGASPPQRTPEYSQKADRETEGHEVVRRFVEFFASNEMDPAYIDGWIFEGLRKQQPEKLKRVGRALNAVSGHVNGNLYLSNFSREAYKGNAKRLERLTTGAVVMGASLGLCYNKKGMGIENLGQYTSAPQKASIY